MAQDEPVRDGDKTSLLLAVEASMTRALDVSAWPPPSWSVAAAIVDGGAMIEDVAKCNEVCLEAEGTSIYTYQCSHINKGNKGDDEAENEITEEELKEFLKELEKKLDDKKKEGKKDGKSDGGGGGGKKGQGKKPKKPSKPKHGSGEGRYPPDNPDDAKKKADEAEKKAAARAQANLLADIDGGEQAICPVRCPCIVTAIYFTEDVFPMNDAPYKDGTPFTVVVGVICTIQMTCALAED